MDEITTIVIDNGSFTYKIGYSGDESPTVLFRNLYGKTKPGSGLNDIFIGNEALDKSFFLDVKYPVEQGNVTDWEQMEEIIKYGFNKLNADPQEHSILIPESSNITKENREKMVQIMFEKYDVPSYYSINQGVLNIVGSGLTSGYSVDVGYSLTQVVPVLEYHAIEYSTFYEKLAGHELIQYLNSLLIKINGYSIFQNAFRKEDFLSDLLQNSCYFALNYLKEFKSQDFSSNIIKDTEKYEAKDSLFKGPELLFDTSLYQPDKTPIHQLFFKSKEKTNEFFEDIVISGGVSAMNGFKERFHGEMQFNGSSTFHMNVISNGEYGAWAGGSVFSSLPNYQDLTIKKDEYKEAGARIVHYKCF